MHEMKALTWTREQEAASLALFNNGFCFAELNGYIAHVLLNDDPEDYPQVFIRVIFDDEAQRQNFLREHPKPSAVELYGLPFEKMEEMVADAGSFVLHPYEVEI